MENQVYKRSISFQVVKGRVFYFFLTQYLLLILSLGFYSPWARNNLSKYPIREIYFMGKKFELHNYPIKTYFFLIWFVIILFFLLGLWYLNAIFIPYFVHHYCKRLAHSYSYRGLKFSYSGDITDSYRIFFIFIFSTLLSLGLAFPWALGNLFCYYLNNFQYDRFRGFSSKLNYKNLYNSFYMHILLPFTLCLIALVGYILLANTYTSSNITMLYKLSFLQPMIFINIFLILFSYTIHSFNKVINNFEFKELILLDSQLSSAEIFSLLFKWIFISILTLGVYYPIGKLNFINYLIKNIKIIFLINLKKFLKLSKI